MFEIIFMRPRQMTSKSVCEWFTGDVCVCVCELRNAFLVIQSHPFDCGGHEMPWWKIREMEMHRCSHWARAVCQIDVYSFVPVFAVCWAKICVRRRRMGASPWWIESLLNFVSRNTWNEILHNNYLLIYFYRRRSYEPPVFVGSRACL